ncbi:hypothetical protein BY458DRAFT_525135 [Sporodiniella umbellata]|nr:hypothetical protein BY458DRAFT_525135 [Sporodiniella umbellata]
MTKAHNNHHSHHNNHHHKKNKVVNDNPMAVLDREVHAPDSYVVSSEEANKPLENDFVFFSRVWSIPLIRESTTKAQAIANHFALSRLVLNGAEATFRTAVNLTSPYAEKYKSQLKKVDDFGCQSLDLVESKIDPQLVMTSPQRYYTDVKGRLMTYTNESVEGWVNKYLPQENDDVSMRSPSEDHKSLADKVRDRLASRARTDLNRLVETNRLLQEALHSIQSANNRLQDLVVSLKGGYNATQSKANARLHELSVDLIHRVDAAAAYAKERHMVDNLPSVVHPLIQLASGEYDIIRTEMLKSDVTPLQKATNILHVNQSYVLPIIQNSTQEIQKQIHDIREYSLNNRVVREVKSTLGLVNAKA